MIRNISKYAFFILSAISLTFSSCKKDDTLMYGNITMGNFSGDTFISDQGNEFTIVENLSGTTFEEFRRAIMMCDVLKKVEGKDRCYEVRVVQADTVFTKEPIDTETAAADPQKQVDDPVMVDQLWVSGGYLNMYIMFEVQINPKKEDGKHMINLVYKKDELGTGKYSISLRHNSFGETLGAASEEDAWGIAGTYISFPLSEIINEKSAEVTLNWREHVVLDRMWQKETIARTTNFIYSKDNFEHAPRNTQSKTRCSIE